MVEADDDLVTCGPVLMEVFAGAQDEDQALAARRLLARCEYVAAEDPTDFEAAAGIYRRCRASGGTVRGFSDCLIAAVAVRIGASVLHRDRDFDTIAAATPLRIVPLDPG